MHGLPYSGKSLAIIALMMMSAGCHTGRGPSPQFTAAAAPPLAANSSSCASEKEQDIQLTAFHQSGDAAAAVTPEELQYPESVVAASECSLSELEDLAINNNPALRRLRQEAAAEWARVRYIDELPDPTISSMAYAPPMAYEPDRLLAELQVMQMIPWIGRLRAEAQQATFEALAAVNDYQAERLRVIGDLRAAWLRLYVLNKQIEITEAEKAQLQTLINSANARVRTGDAQPGDVLLATLELSNLQEQLIAYRQEVKAMEAEINRLAGRPAQCPVAAPDTIYVELPPWDYELPCGTALSRQPEVNAARMRVSATRWGIEVARLQRRPDVTLGAGWMIMDAPGAIAQNAGRDSATIGVTATIPLWREKYDAMTTEASRKHYAAHASEDEVVLQLESLLRSLWEQARASHQTVQLYEHSIIPQARQTFEADQASLANNAVTFDRVIRDYRSVLSMQLGYHRALGQLATALARIQQAVGEDLALSPQP